MAIKFLSDAKEKCGFLADSHCHETIHIDQQEQRKLVFQNKIRISEVLGRLFVSTGPVVIIISSHLMVVSEGRKQ